MNGKSITHCISEERRLNIPLMWTSSSTKSGITLLAIGFYQKFLKRGKIMTKEMQEKLFKALDEIKDSYDAFYIANKLDDDNTRNTHKEQFALLSKELELPLNRGALAWIKYEYDCYYKDEYENEEDTAFGYIRNIILSGGIRLDSLGKEDLIKKVEAERKNGVFVPNGYATCCVSCKHFKILHDIQGAYYGCAKNKGRLPVMPPMCNLKER